MKLYRLARPKYANDLTGQGAKIHGGRWNSPGKPVLYSAANSSLAALEILAGADKSFILGDFTLITLEVAKNATFFSLSADDLPSGWQNYPAPHQCQLLGDKWLEDEKDTLLKVPCAVNPYEHNYLINPNMLAQADLKIINEQVFSFDLRFT